jgi:hypothetical protein
MKNTHGQAGLEGLIVLGVIFLMFTGLMLLYFAKNNDVLNSQSYLGEKKDCLALANTISTVFILGSGSSMEVFVEHDLTIYPNLQRINTDNSICFFPIRLDGLNESINVNAGNVRIVNSQPMEITNA